jgi:Fe-S cluster assembly ATP-binding protein
MLKMDQSFAGRYLNEGFSGGEKKRAEILQMATLRPEIAILDETDSGLDIDALRIVADGVNALMSSDMGVLVITHYQRLLNYIKPHFVHIMLDGELSNRAAPTWPCTWKSTATIGCAKSTTPYPKDKKQWLRD